MGDSLFLQSYDIFANGRQGTAINGVRAKIYEFFCIIRQY
jgi:hypothetical protein